jgi:predicted TIM-barrel fold metal-dependent hydrolase
LFDLRYEFDGGSLHPVQTTLEDLRAMHRIVGIERGVFVHAGQFADNQLLLDSLKADKDLRGIAILKPGMTDAELHTLDSAGTRGVRISAAIDGAKVLDEIEATAERIAPFDWHLQLHFPGTLLPALVPRLKKLPVPVVIDHCARITPQQGPGGPEFKALAQLMDTGRAWLKLSAPYRISERVPPYKDTEALGKALVALASEHAVWGTDWPNTMHSGPMPDAGMLLDVLETWCPDEATRNRILVDNPKKLYRF